MVCEAKLVWVTPDAERVIAYCARVSNPKNQENKNISGLIKYCLKNKHWSVFEMASICIEVKCSRAIARQILRHRSFNFQEFSQRYAEVGGKLDFDFVTARTQDELNRQNSIDLDETNEYLLNWFDEVQAEVIKVSTDNYKASIEKGIAKEVARALLPEGLTPTVMYMSGTVRSWLHYLEVRCGNGTQREHVEIANEIKKVVKESLPLIGTIL